MSGKPEMRIRTNPALRDGLLTVATEQDHAASCSFAVEACTS